MLKTKLAILALGVTCLANQPDRLATGPAEAPVIVRVVARDSTITVRAGAADPIYSVESPTGEQLVPPSSLQTLQAQHPEVARKVQALHAGAWAGLE